MKNSKYISGKILLLQLTVAIFVVAIVLGKSVTVVSAQTDTCLGEIPPDVNLSVNVTEGVTNDADSGENGNYWAIDNYVRHIKVWSQADNGIYCADVRYDGTFDVQPGVESPGIAIATLTGNEDGVMTGGRRAQINGSLLADALWPTTGDVGTFNYNCDLSGNCPDLVNWTDKYFQEGYDYSDLNWEWTYTSCGHGQWINSSAGSSGDIVVGPTDEVCTQPTPLPTPPPPPSDHGDGQSDGRSDGGSSTPQSSNVLGASTGGSVLGASTDTLAATGSNDQLARMLIAATAALTLFLLGQRLVRDNETS